MVRSFCLKIYSILGRDVNIHALYPFNTAVKKLEMMSKSIFVVNILFIESHELLVTTFIGGKGLRLSLTVGSFECSIAETKSAITTTSFLGRFNGSDILGSHTTLYQARA